MHLPDLHDREVFLYCLPLAPASARQQWKTQLHRLQPGDQPGLHTPGGLEDNTLVGEIQRAHALKGLDKLFKYLYTYDSYST